MIQIKQWTLFIVLPFVFWAILLLILKFRYGPTKVGWAAGGDVIDIVQMGKAGIKRKGRKQRILRSWRLQYTFLVACILIPVATAFLVRYGIKSLVPTWAYIQSINDDVESLAYRGVGIIENLDQAKGHLKAIDLTPQAVHAKNQSPQPSLYNNATWCPGNSTSGTKLDSVRLEYFNQIMTSIQNQLSNVTQFMDDRIPKNDTSFVVVTEANHYVTNSLLWANNHIWLLKFFIMILNVVNLLFIAIVQCLSKNNVIHPPTRFYVSFVLIPLLSALAFLFLFMTAFFGVGTVLNADFCSGGPEPGSPAGSISDAILINKFDTMNPPLASHDIIYEAFLYYSNVRTIIMQDKKGMPNHGLVFAFILTCC